MRPITSTMHRLETRRCIFAQQKNDQGLIGASPDASIRDAGRRRKDKFLSENEVCYNGDVNGDAKFGLAAVLHTHKQIVK